MKLRLDPSEDEYGLVSLTGKQFPLTRKADLSDILQAVSSTRVAEWLDNQSVDDAGKYRVQIKGDNALLLSAATIAALDEREAAIVGAPPPSALSIDIASTGYIYDSNFQINLYHVRPGGVRVAASRQGAFLRYDGRLWRLPEPLYSAVCAAELLQSPILEEEPRIHAFAKLKSVLPDELQANLSDGYGNHP